MNSDLKELSLALDSSAVFANVVKNEVIAEMKKLLELIGEGSDSDIIRQYSAFTRALYSHTVNFSEYILKTVFEDENIFIVRKG